MFILSKNKSKNTSTRHLREHTGTRRYTYLANEYYWRNLRGTVVRQSYLKDWQRVIKRRRIRVRQRSAGRQDWRHRCQWHIVSTSAWRGKHALFLERNSSCRIQQSLSAWFQHMIATYILTQVIWPESAVTVMLGWIQYTTNQPHDAARALETIQQSSSCRSERTCNILFEGQCHAAVHCQKEPYHILPLPKYNSIVDFATSKSRKCQQCSQKNSQSLRIAHNLQTIIFKVSVDQFVPMIYVPNNIIAINRDELLGFTLWGEINYGTSRYLEVVGCAPMSHGCSTQEEMQFCLESLRGMARSCSRQP